MSDAKMKRAPLRLMSKLGESVAFLDAAVAKQRKTLMKTLDWAPGTGSAEGHQVLVR